MAQGELKRKPELFFCPRWSWLTHHRVCLYIYTLDQKTARTWPVCRRRDPYHSLLTSMIYNQFFHLICWGLEAMDNLDVQTTFSKFYGKVGVITWFLFHLIWKNYVLYWDFDLKSWIVDFFTGFTQEKTPQNNFSRQNFSVENNYWRILWKKLNVADVGSGRLALLNKDFPTMTRLWILNFIEHITTATIWIVIKFQFCWIFFFYNHLHAIDSV